MVPKATKHINFVSITFYTLSIPGTCSSFAFPHFCILFHYQTTFPLCPGEATATGGDITFKTVKDATWDARAKWDHLAINLGVAEGTIKVSIVQIDLAQCYSFTGESVAIMYIQHTLHAYSVSIG